LPALVLQRKPLSGLAKRHIQPERYVPFFLKKFVKESKKGLKNLK
jgi:hypothetical protein